jgi:hypothetical protein
LLDSGVILKMVFSLNQRFSGLTLAEREAIASLLSQESDGAVHSPSCYYVHLGISVQAPCRENVPVTAIPGFQ